LLPPTWRSSLLLLAALFAFAVVWHFMAALVVLAAIVAAPFLLLAWLAPRYPAAASILYAFIIGIISSLGSGGYYRRRRWC
jgi:hypothetical protein